MIRISTIFIAICMVLVAASLGLSCIRVAGISGTKSAIVALTALTFLILYNAVSMRLRDRTDVGGQIADLSRGTADLARQVAEFGRRLAAVEGRWCRRIRPAPTASRPWSARSTNSARWSSSSRSRSRAMTTCCRRAPAPPRRRDQPDDEPQKELPLSPAETHRRRGRAPAAPAPPVAAAERRGRLPAARRQILAAVKSAVEENRIDIFLQPMVTLPQRKVRFYEAVTRLRDDKDQLLAADDFIAVAEAAGLIGRIDHMVMLKCVQVLRRLMVRNKDVGVFCNVAAATLGQSDHLRAMPRFPRSQPGAGAVLRARIQAGDVAQSRRRPRPSISRRWRSAASASRSITSPTCGSSRANSPTAASASSRCRRRCCSIQKQTSASDIHPSDLSDLLGRFGIDLIAERIEGERAVVDLLDYDVRFGQGFLFAPPRPLRPEGASATGGAHPEQGAGAQWLRQSRIRSMRPAIDPAAGDRQRRAGAPRRRAGLTGHRRHDDTPICRAAARPRRRRATSCSAISGAWSTTGWWRFPRPARRCTRFAARAAP